jgi:hypothetical protein
MRASDRCEAVARIIAVLVLLAAVPVAVGAGTTCYRGALVRERAYVASVTTVAGTVTERPTAVAQGSVAPARTWQTQVVWSRAGHTHTATVHVPATVVPGDRVPVHLGRDGHPVGDVSASDLALGDGVDLATEIFGGAAFGVGIVLAGLHSALEYRRRADWAREWRGLSRTADRG